MVGKRRSAARGRAKLVGSELWQRTSHALVPTLQFTDPPAHLPDEDVSELHQRTARRQVARFRRI
jgi:hypothetical protein